MRSRLLPCLLLTLGSTTASTAQEYSVATLADSLRQNAQAVVRLYETDFQYNSPSSATARHDIVVTLLDRRGARHADLVCYVDMVQFAEKLLRRDLRRLRPRDPQTRQRRPELYRIFPASGRRCGLLLARTAVIGLPMYRPLPLRDGAQERHVRHAAFRPAVDRHRRSTGKGAFPAVDPCRLCVQLPMHALPCRTRAAYGSRPRQLRMDIPVPHGRARRTADSARPRTAADPLLRAVGVHLRQNAREYAGLAPFRRLDGRTARGPRTAASGLAGRNTRPNRHDPRQTGKNRGALPLSGTHDPLREYPVGHRRLAADGRRNGLCE